MFNKSGRNRCSKRHLLEDEPPEKQLVSDADLFIKSLAEKQRTTETSLAEQLQSKKEFYKSTELVSLTNYTSGSSSLGQFLSVTKHADEIERLKSCGLTSEDIELYFDSKLGTEHLKGKHKNFNETIIRKRLEEIEKVLESNSKVPRQEVDQRTHKTEFVLSTKPESVETKLLKFALQNQHKDNTLPRAIDSIKEVEENFMLGILNEREIKKIRKKARSLNNQIETLNRTELHTRTPSTESVATHSLAKKSKWDLKEVEEPKQKVVKTYSCKPRKWYTVRNGQIVQIDGDELQRNGSDDILNENTIQLTVEEIKKLPKFENYTAGVPSEVL